MKKRILLAASVALSVMIASVVQGTDVEQLGLKPIMPQKQLLAQKDVLEILVRYAWESCLIDLEARYPNMKIIDKNEDGVSNVNWQLERLPKTDKDVFFIKRIVQNVVAEMTLTSMQFDRRTKVVQEQALREMLQRLMSTALIELLLKDISEPLNWCTCTAEYKRITLAVLMANEARERFPDKNKRIVYTSFASGGLLQDYLVLSELLVSHTNLLVNLVDLEYPDIPAIAKEDLDADNTHDLHTLERKNRREQAALIDGFKTKMAQIISTRESVGKEYNFEVNIYQSAYELIARVQQRPDEKTNILMLVDPNVGSFGIADYPSLANVINIWIDQEKAPVFTLYVPRHQGVHLYELIGMKYEDEPLTVDKEIMDYLRDELVSLIKQTGADKKYISPGTDRKYNPQLVKELLSKAFGLPVTDEVMVQAGFPQLMQWRANLKKQMLKDGSIDGNLVQPLTLIKLGNQPVLISWGTDAHISFQDLVWDILAPNAMVYQLYATDPLDFGNKSDKIIKVVPETYKLSDVITPNNGRYSTDKPMGRQSVEEEQLEEVGEEVIIEDGDESEEQEEFYFESLGKYQRIL